MTNTFIKFVMEKHAGQVRKATGMPYYTHLAEVAGFTAMFVPGVRASCVAWGHDLLEDTNAKFREIRDVAYDEGLTGEVSSAVADDIASLTDTWDSGSTRAEKHASAMLRLAAATKIAQSVKCADVCSNAGSIHLLALSNSPWVLTYLDEKEDTLHTCSKAPSVLRELGFTLVRRARELVRTIKASCT